MLTTWNSGIPKNDGIFWFDSGLPKCFNRSMKRSLVLQVSQDNLNIFTKSGMLPLSGICNYKLCRPKWSAIRLPRIWQHMKSLSPYFSRMWVIHPQGYTGLGLLERDWTAKLCGHIVWLNNPTYIFEKNVIIKMHTDLMFSPIEAPFCER